MGFEYKNGSADEPRPDEPSMLAAAAAAAAADGFKPVLFLLEELDVLVIDDDDDDLLPFDLSSLPMFEADDKLLANNAARSTPLLLPSFLFPD